MSKSIKILSIILIIFSLMISFYSVYATDINMNLMDNQIANEVLDNNEITNDVTNEVDSQLPTDTDTDETSVAPSNVGATTEEGLTFSNILSILLITVGVILIFLAIAIIIRLNR